MDVINMIQIEVNGQTFTDCMECTLLFMAQHITHKPFNLINILNHIDKVNNLVEKRTIWAKFLYQYPHFVYKKNEVELKACLDNLKTFFEMVIGCRIFVVDDLRNLYKGWSFEHNILPEQNYINDHIAINIGKKHRYTVKIRQKYDAIGLRITGHAHVTYACNDSEIDEFDKYVDPNEK